MPEMQRRKILFLAHSPEFNGADKVLYQVVERLRHDCRVLVVLPAKGEMMRRLEAFSDVELSIQPLPRFSLAPRDIATNLLQFIPFLVSFRRLLTRFGPDVVYGNTIRSVIPVAIARSFGYRPLVHFHERNESGAAGRLVARLAGRASFRNIFVCRSVLGSYARHSPDLAARSAVVYNGIAIPTTGRTDADEPPEFAGRAPRLLSVAQLAPHKRIGDLLEALPAILDAFPRAALVVLGEGSHRPILESRARELRIEGHVRFPGYANDPMPLLHAADIFLAPFENEACNMAVLEAMAAGKPVVAADRGGLPEQVADGETGFLFPAGDIDALTDRVARLAGDADLRRRLGEAAARLVAERFSLSAQVERIRDEIEAVATGGKKEQR